MSIALILKQNDTFPPLEATLSDSKGAIDLTLAEKVELVMKLKTGSTVVEGQCEVLPGTEGKVKYAWAAGDTAVVGVWEVEFKITWGPGEVESVPNASYDEIEIQKSL